MLGVSLPNFWVAFLLVVAFSVSLGWLPPLGRGTGGPGYRFADEFQSGRKFDKVGLLAMANAGPGTNGSQFFVTVAETHWLNNKHTIFGEVADQAGRDVVESVRPPRVGEDSPEPRARARSRQLRDHVVDRSHERAHVVGHHTGAVIAMEIAAAFPDRVNRMLVEARSPVALPQAEADIRLLLRTRHRIAEGMEDDFVVRRQDAAIVLAACEAREKKEAENRKRLAAGELGLDIYKMREPMKAKGLVYMTHEEYRAKRS